MTTIKHIAHWIDIELWRFTKFIGRLLLILTEVLVMIAGIVVAVDHSLILGAIILVGLFYWWERTGRV